MTATRPAVPVPGPSLDQLVLVAEGEAQGWRTRRGERLDHVFEERCDWIRQYGRAGHLAVDSDELAMTYDELDSRANQLARYLRLRGAKPGDRIALLFDRPAYSYLAMLAVLKISAAYVPLDVGFPTDRMAYIVEDAGAQLLVSMSHVRDKVENFDDITAGGAETIFIDNAMELIAEMDSRRLIDSERGRTVDQLAYIIYTSGSTGRPKGVAIDHPSICNFVRVAAEVYGIRARDRVYQGLTIAFDFSVEEIWVPWASGATLVPKPPGGSLLGQDLHDFLTSRRVTAMCCVPTLLATVEDDLPDLRFLLVSGEACPQDLIARWHRPGRRFLNVYGPTEATVTATWTEVHPDKPVTIGVPLPTYATVILDTEDPHRALPHGETGEIGIAGIGLACGYLNRDDLTNKAFIDDFLGIPANPSGRIYRTGDLGRVNGDGEIEYQGRIDLQVKIRGYRIELTEIESVLLQVPGIAAAVVDTYSPNPETTELVGYYSLRADTASVDQEAIYALLRERLPKYMVPAYLEHLDAIPMTPQDKADRKNLPPPGQRTTRAPQGKHVAAATDTQRALAAAMAKTLGVDQISVDSHFFDELGASSLLMAQFTAQVRREAALPKISMRDIYLNPTIRQLAASLGDVAPTGSGSAAGSPSRAAAAPIEVVAKPIARGSSAGYVLCGVAQLLFVLATAYLSGVVLKIGLDWTMDGVGLPHIAGRAAAFCTATLVGLVALPILVKWLLMDDWKAREIRLWSAGYLRFWLVKVMIRANPMVLFAGSPVYNWYLRALGAKIGREVTILSSTVPVATDLITIGDGSVIRKESSFTGYRAVGGVIQVGPVTLGRYTHVGEKSVLDIATSMGDGAQLGHSSTLQAGQAVPAGQSWHGCPAEQTQVDYRTVAPAKHSPRRKLVYGLLQLIGVLVTAPVLFTALALVFKNVPAVVDLMRPASPLPGTWRFYAVLAVLAAVVYFGLLVLQLLSMVTVPRLLNVFLTPGKVYPLYGLAYLTLGAITRMTNSKFFMLLFGDSSYIVGYVRALGYRVTPVEQTGSNLGTEMRHDNPFLTRIGTGTMISDGLSVMNTDYSNTSFRVSQVTVGARNFLGNNIAYPSGARLGENVLLATKVMVPIDGPVRENIGLLGSPPFEIPRGNPRESAELAFLNDPAQVRRKLAAKNRANAAGICVVLLIRFAQFLANLVIGALTLHFYEPYGSLTIWVALLAVLVFNSCYAAVIERAVRGFRPLTPRNCSIYDRYFWGHELLWKVYTRPSFAGTPFNPVLWRLAGVRMGRRVFDDGAAIPEKSLTSIGDDTVLNAGCVLQGHSLEDGLFKSGYTSIGTGCSIGVNAFVHYGVTMGDGAVLDSDAFLMKGTEVGAHEWWQGNPADQIQEPDSPNLAGQATPVTLPAPARRDVPVAAAAAVVSRQRVLGVDLARGLALLGMMAVHVFPLLDADGDPTPATWLASGRSAATFVLLAGVALTFLSGGRTPLHGRARVAASTGIVVRALLIGAVGLALGYTGQAEVILPYYAVFFVLALPLLGLRGWALGLLASALLVVAPAVLVLTFGAGLPVISTTNPTFATLVNEPLALLSEVLLTGPYPAITYLVYLLVGLAIGRSDLTSVRVAQWLAGGGAALAVVSWSASTLLLTRFGGAEALRGATGTETDPAKLLDVLNWHPVPPTAPNLWWLALRAPHSNSTLDVAQTLGSAMAVLGFMLLLSRAAAAGRLLRPLAAAGGMTLTFYSAHLIVLATGVLSDHPAVLYFEMVGCTLVFGMFLWLTLGRGPLEWLVGATAAGARRLVAGRLATGDPTGLGAELPHRRQLAPPPVARADAYRMAPGQPPWRQPPTRFQPAPGQPPPTGYPPRPGHYPAIGGPSPVGPPPTRFYPVPGPGQPRPAPGQPGGARPPAGQPPRPSAHQPPGAPLPPGGQRQGAQPPPTGQRRGQPPAVQPRQAPGQPPSDSGDVPALLTRIEELEQKLRAIEERKRDGS
ncbi:MAG TPA: Pls/PosA family non-ribosomal peptide synthetase [Pseudonocardia sp.]|nr:Pls/PosA family non-ribosomal peptide synthetase [Pseudonocardia sp.]